MRLLRAVDPVNSGQKCTLVSKIVAHSAGGSPATTLDGLHFALWGLSFKPHTDDVREAPSVVIASKLVELGATVRAYDPEATAQTKKVLSRAPTRCCSSPSGSSSSGHPGSVSSH